MMRVTQAALPRLTAPLLVIHARRDHTAAFACAPRIAALASRTSDRRIVELHHSSHLIAIDVERVADRHTDASAPGTPGDPPCAT